jgi:hypothetical protein
MHIEFKLPTGAGGQAAHYFNTVLDRELQEWSSRYQCPYTKTLYYYKAHVELLRPEGYTIFVLTWQWETPRYRLEQD